MSYINIIRNLLGIQDKNIIFEENCVSEKIISGVRTTIVDAKLIGETLICNCCDQPHIIKHGFSDPAHVLLPKGQSKLKTILRLRKQRYICKNCKKTEIVTTPLVDKCCTISNPLRLSILHDATKKRSEVEIAYDNCVSNTTVARIINETYHNLPRFKKLPKILLFDEFKSTKDAIGAMSFIMIDGDNGEILDILESRMLAFLKTHFKTYTKEDRAGVEMIVIDMYAPYMSLVKSMFPKAKIVLDRFHIVGLVNTAMKFTRINIMNQFDKKSKEYKRLKYDWELLQKNERNLSNKRYYCRRWKKWITSKEKIEWLLNTSEELTITYRFYQDVLYAIKSKNKEQLISLIEKPPAGISKRMVVSVSSMIKYKEYVLNALETDHSNGRIEGTINFIKVIKRIAFGYRSFVRFKTRILMIHEYDPIKIDRKKKEKAKLERQKQKELKTQVA